MYLFVFVRLFHIQPFGFSCTLTIKQKWRPVPQYKKNLQAAVAFGANGKLYRDCMQLIEEAHSYIHGEGRLVIRSMSPDLARFYSAQAMQLSTCLMQTASLLLMLRAVMEGDMSIKDMKQERAKIVADMCPRDEQNPLWAHVPEEFHTINQKTLSLAWQAKHASHSIDNDNKGDFRQGKNAVEHHMNRLKTAFPDKV